MFIGVLLTLWCYWSCRRRRRWSVTTLACFDSHLFPVRSFVSSSSVQFNNLDRHLLHCGGGALLPVREQVVVFGVDSNHHHHRHHTTQPKWWTDAHTHTHTHTQKMSKLKAHSTLFGALWASNLSFNHYHQILLFLQKKVDQVVDCASIVCLRVKQQQQQRCSPQLINLLQAQVFFYALFCLL